MSGHGPSLLDTLEQRDLNSLQARTKWQKKQPNLEVGDIVILKPRDHFFNCHWPLARVIETYPGEDGLVRVVTIKTATGTFKRAVTRLSLLFRQNEQEPVPQPLPPGVCADTTTTSAQQDAAAVQQFSHHEPELI